MLTDPPRGEALQGLWSQTRRAGRAFLVLAGGAFMLIIASDVSQAALFGDPVNVATMLSSVSNVCSPSLLVVIMW